MRQPSLGLMFQKYRTGVRVDVAVHTAVKLTVEIPPLREIFVNVTFGKRF